METTSNKERCSAISTGRADSGGASAAADSGHGGGRAAGDVGAPRGGVRAAGAACDSCRETAAGAVAADSVWAAQRAATDGADELQPAVSLVCGFEPGRCGVGGNGVHEEPGAAAARRDGAALAGGGVGAGAGTRSAERRTLHGGGDAAGSVGEAAEFRAQGSAAGGHGGGGKKLLRDTHVSTTDPEARL